MNDEVNPHTPENGAGTLQEAVKRRWHEHPVLVALVVMVLAFYALMGMTAAALAFRLSQGPLDLGFALPVAEKIMSRNAERMRFDIGAMTLTWQGRKNPLAIEMDNIRLIGPGGEFLTIGRADLGLSAWRLLLARVYFNYAEIQNLSLRVVRLENGALTLTGADTGHEKPAARSVALQLDNIVNDLPAIERLKLAHMGVIFEDQKEAVVRRFDDVNMEIRQTRGFSGRSVSGYLTAALSGEGGMAAVDFIYDASDKTLTAMARMEKADTRRMLGNILRAANLPIIDMLVQGRAEARLKNDFSLDSLNLQLQGDDGMLYWPRNYGEGLENQKLTNFDLHIDYAPETRSLELLNAEITVKGITLQVSGALSADENWREMEGDIVAAIPVVAVDALPAVWPKVWDTGGREWLVDRMDKGRFAKISVNVPLTATQRYIAPDDTDIEIALDTPEMDPEGQTSWDIATGTIRGTFNFTGVTVDYREPLLPARETTGTGVYEGLGLTLNIDSAKIGNLNVTDGLLEFDDLITPGAGHAHLEFNMNGPVEAVFQYLEKEPISYKDKVSLDASAARGKADIKLKVDFPTLADMEVDDVRVTADAKLTALSVPGAVKGLTLAGPAFALEASENHFKISGTGTLEGRPATVEWEELFSPKPSDAFSSRLKATIDTDKNIREKFIGTLESRVDGSVPVDVTLVTTPAGKGDLRVTAVLDNAAVDFTDPFNARKEKGAPATAKLTGTLQDNNILSIDTLSIGGAGMGLTSGNIAFGRDAEGDPTLARATLKGLRLGETNADITATWKGENDITAAVNGLSFDARWIMGDAPAPAKDGAKTQTAKTPLSYNLKLKLGRLFIANRALENAEGEFVGATTGIIRLANLDAISGGQPLALRYSATGGAGDRMLLEMGNAGYGLSALGITDRVRGGTLRASGMPRPGGQPGDMQGKLVLQNFSIRQAPVLAKLVNLLSLPGILNLLNQDTGLSFERAESDLTWLNKPGGPSIYFADGRTSGASLGLTFEGQVDMAADTMNIKGTAVPMSEVNSLVASIPLVGDILTGGKKGSGIFAATYSMSGASADPDVSINPLSVLTPGILRRILFEGASAPKAPAPEASKP